jgi:hypothetical protein
MPEPELEKTNSSQLKTKSCKHFVGTTECQHCVSNGTCPSNIKTIEKISDVEKGRKYCYGQS